VIRGALLALLATGCVVALPPSVDPAALPACSAGSYGVLSSARCERDEDCRACDLGAGCRVTTSTDCEPDCEVHCCEGRCVVPSAPAELGDDQPWK
jgi:hypothetical protein